MKKGISIALALMLFAFSFAAAETAGATSQTITYVENQTTGYTWIYSVSDESVLTVTDQGYVADANAEKAEGVGGTHAWVIAGKAEGTASVTFTLGQQWDGGEVADKIIYTYQVDSKLQLTLNSIDGIPELYMPDKAAIVLTENPTTGFQWAYKASAEGILTPELDQYVAPAETEGETLVGQGGEHVWTFAGAKEGDVTLTFMYARSWEEGVKPEATVTYTFHVGSDLTVTQTEIGGDYETYDPLMASTTAE